MTVDWPAEGEIWYNFAGNFVTKLLAVNFEARKVRYIHKTGRQRNHVVPLREFADAWLWRRVRFADGRPTGFDVPPKEKRPARIELTTPAKFEADQVWRNHLLNLEFHIHRIVGSKVHGWLNGNYTLIYLTDLSGQDWLPV